MSGYVQLQIRNADADGPLFAGWRLRAYLDLCKRADYRTREVMASSRELALCWEADDAAVERWIKAMVEAEYLAVRRLGNSPRAGRALVLLSVAEPRGNQRGKTEAISEAKNPRSDGVPANTARQSARQNRGNQRGTSKEGSKKNSPPTGERELPAASPPQSVALTVISGGLPDHYEQPADPQRMNGGLLVEAWIHEWEKRGLGRPPQELLGEQGAHGKWLAERFGRDEILAAWLGMDRIFKYSHGGMWTLKQLRQDFAEAVGKGRDHPRLKKRRQTASFLERLQNRRTA